MKYTGKQITSFLHDIENGVVTLYKLPEDLYTAIAEYLKKGVFKGFGSTISNVPGIDLELLTNLTENVYMFGAAKTYQQVKEISGLLVNPDTGKVRTSREFNKLGREKFELWNDDWGKAEYNTAVGQAQMASKWAEIERQKDILPNLRYSAIGDACAICRPLDGIVAPVESPIWKKVSPLNHFNCFCVLLQEGDKVKLTPNPEGVTSIVEGRMSETFLHNPYFTGQVFPKGHPYFDVPKKDRVYASKNFNLPIPKKL